MKMKRSHAVAYTAFALSLVLSLAVAAMISCGGSTTTSSNSTTATVNTYLSDPPTCSLEFIHVWVTITKVEANISTTDNSNWQTLVDFTGSPKQIDLMSLHPSTKNPDFCGTLYLLGTKALPPGKYQQIRLFLLSNNPSSPPAIDNKCSGAGWNCVDTGTEKNPNLSELYLSSQAQTGIKIPSSQIANGGLTVSAGQSVDFNVNIDIDACASIVQEGNGQYRFKPVLHAGEISTNGANTISGKVVEGAGSPNPGMGIGGAIVLLEQPDSTTPTPVDRVIWSGTTNSDGTFAFCPVSPANGSNYDVVAAGTSVDGSTTTTYNPTVVFNVPIGGATGNLPLYPETSGGGSADPATISGQITTADASSPSKPISGEVQLSTLQSATNPEPPSGGPSTVLLTIPTLDAGSTPGDKVTDSQPPIYTTVDNTSSSTPAGCATTSFDCVGYSVMVPASAVAIGTYDSTNGNNVTQPSGSATSQAMYTIEGLANGDDGLLNCTSPTNGDAMSNQVTVSSGSAISSSGTTPAEPTLDFTFSGCSAP